MTSDNIPRPVYLTFVYILNRFTVSFFCMGFYYQYWDSFKPVYEALHYAGFWVMLAMFIAMMVLPRKRSDKVKSS